LLVSRNQRLFQQQAVATISRSTGSLCISAPNDQARAARDPVNAHERFMTILTIMGTIAASSRQQVMHAASARIRMKSALK
jgi:hypothetical protein